MSRRIDMYEAKVGNSEIVATRVVAETGEPAIDRARSTFEVRIDGELRGMIVMPHGFGKGWQAWAFGSVALASWDNDRPRILNGYGTPGWCEGPETLLRLFPGWKARRLAPTREEIAAFVEKVKREKIRNDEALRRRIAAEDRAYEERLRREGAARKDRLAAIRSLGGKLGDRASPAEASALREVTEALEAEVAADEAKEADRARRRAEAA